MTYTYIHSNRNGISRGWQLGTRVHLAEEHVRNTQTGGLTCQEDGQEGVDVTIKGRHDGTSNSCP